MTDDSLDETGDFIDGLIEEYFSRVDRGENLSIEEYQSDHPELADELGKLITAAMRLRSAKNRAADGPDGNRPQAKAPSDRTAGELSAGDTVDHFRIVSRLGGGGMGVVYEADDTSLHRRVALKVITPSLLQDDRENLIAFLQQEAQAAAGLHHTNIVQVYGVGAAENPYIAMQLVRGHSLEEVVEVFRDVRSDLLKPHAMLDSSSHALIPETAPLDVELKTVIGAIADGSFGDGRPKLEPGSTADAPDQTGEHKSQEVVDLVLGSSPTESSLDRAFCRSVARIGVQVAEALQHAHEQGIIHRDIKPANLMLDIHGTVWVADFGLAQPVETEASAGAELAGTLAYMAPERFERTADSQSDVYALGLTLYEVLTGERAFKAAAFSELMRKVRTERPTPIIQIAKSAPRDLTAIIQKSIEPQPAKRYESCDALKNDLLAYLRNEEVSARPQSRPERVYRWCQRKPWIAATLMLIVLLATGSTSAATTLAGKNNDLTEANTELDNLNTALLRKNEEAQRNLDQANATAAELATKQAIRSLSRGDNLDAEQAIAKLPSSQESFDSKLILARSKIRRYRDVTFAEGHWGILDFSISEDGRYVIACDEGGCVDVWRNATGEHHATVLNGRFSNQVLRHLHHSEARETDDISTWGDCVSRLAALPGGSRFIGTSIDGTVYVIDAAAGSAERLFSLETMPTAVDVDRDRVVVIGDEAGNVARFDMNRPTESLEIMSIENSAILTIRSLDSGQWLVGTAAGKLLVKDKGFSKTIAVHDGSSSIWDLAITGDNKRLKIGVAQSDGAVMVLDWDARDSEFSVFSELSPADTSTLIDFHSVAFSSDGRTIFSGGNDGNVYAWNTRTMQPRDVIQLEENDTRRTQLWQTRPRPIAFSRTVPRILSVDETTLAVAGSLSVSFWVTPRTDSVQTSLSTKVTGTSVAFATGRIGELWVVGPDGIIVLQTDNDEIIRQQSGSYSGIAAFPDAPQLALSDSNGVAIWTLERSLIELQRFPTSTAQVSVAVSPDSKWIASVDEIGAIRVWPSTGGDPQLFAPRQSGRPLTGHVAFNSESNAVLAFGAGQTGTLLVRTGNKFFEQPELIDLSGQGGLAAVWNPIHKDAILLSADNGYRKSVVLEKLRDVADLNSPSTIQNTVQLFSSDDLVLAFAASPDRRRIAQLHRDGVVAFVESTHHRELGKLRTNLDKPIALTYDAEGERLAILNEGGELELWQLPERATEVATVTRPVDWEEINVVGPTREFQPGIDSRMVDLDPEDRICVVYGELTRQADGSPVREGRLRLFREDGINETVGGRHAEQFANRCSATSIGLNFGQDNEPLVVFRNRTDAAGPWDGTFNLARRSNDGSWQIEQMLAHGNLGFYPQWTGNTATNEHGMLFFDFGGFYLRSITPNNSPAQSRVKAWGRQGDGMYPVSVRDADGKLHIVANSTRVNRDKRSKVYVLWDNAVLKRELVSTAGKIGSSSIGLSPDGEPLVVHERGSPAIGWERQILVRRDGHWTKWLDLPDDMPRLGTIGIELGTTGQPRFVIQEPSDHSLRLWSWETDTGWEVSKIPIPPDLELPDWTKILEDRQGRLVIAAASFSPIGSWIRIFRENGAAPESTRSISE